MAQPEPKKLTSWDLQEKVFTKWVNAQLIKRGLHIDNLATAFQDGQKLIQLYEVISNESLGKYDKAPRNRHYMIANLNIVLAKINQFIKNAGIKVGFSAEEICDGQLKLILGMIWVVIHKFQIADISEEEMSAKEALLLWCKKKTEGYPGVKVDNFSTSWQDGLAFAALIHRHSPSALDFYSLSKENKVDNLNLAFDVADKEFKIPKLLEASDIVEIKPDEKIVMTYVSYFWRAFATSQKTELAGRRIGKVVTRSKRSSDLCHDYEAKAKELADWTNNRIHKFENDTVENTLEAIQKRIADFSNYRVTEKPPKTAAKLAVETLFANLTSMLKTENRPLYVPPQGLSVKDLDELWRRLTELEQSYSDKLQIELKRQKRIVDLSTDFDSRAEKLLAWVANKSQYLAKQDAHSSSLNVVEGKQRILEAQNSEVTLVEESRLKDLQRLGAEILALNPPNPDHYNSQLAKISEAWSSLKDQSKEYADKLVAEVERHKQIQALTKEFKAESDKLVTWALDHEEYLQRADIGEGEDSVQHVQGKIAELEHYKLEVQAVKERVDGLKELADKILALHPTDPSPINDALARVNALFENLSQLENEYHGKLQSELDRQHKLAQGKEDFTKKADELSQWAAEQEKYLSAQETGNTLELVEGNLRILDDYKGQFAIQTNTLNNLKKLGDEILAIGPANPSYIDSTLQKLFAFFDRLADLERTYFDKLRTEERKQQKLAALLKDLHERAEKLTAYITEKLDQIANNTVDNTLAAVEAKRKEHREFKHEYAANTIRFSDFKKVGLETLAAGPLNPSEVEGTVQHVSSEWGRLAEAVAAFDAKLDDELARQRKIVALNNDLQTQVVEWKNWAESKTKFLSGDVHSDSVASADAKQTALDAYRQARKEAEAKAAETKKLAETIESLNPDDDTAQHVKAAIDTLNQEFARLNDWENVYDGKLQEEKKRQATLVELSNDFHARAKELQAWADKTDAYLSRQETGDTLAGVTEKIAAFEAYKADHDQKSAALEELRAVADKIVATGPADESFVHNALTNFSTQWDRLNDLAKSYESKLGTEHKRQETLVALFADFNAKAEELSSWISEQEAKIKATTVENTLADVQEKIAEYQEFLKAQDEANGRLAAFRKVSQEILGVGPLHPSEVHTTVQKVNGAWQQLSETSRGYNAKLQSELARQKKIANQLKQLEERVAQLNQWVTEKSEFLSSSTATDSVNNAQEKINSVEAFHQDWTNTSNRLDATSKFGDQILALNPSDPSAVTTPIGELKSKFEELKASAGTRKTTLDGELTHQEKLEGLRKDFAKRAEGFVLWVEDANGLLTNPVSGNTVEDAQAALDKFNDFNNNKKPQRAGEFDGIRTLAGEMKDAGITDNEYSRFTLDELNAKWEELGQLSASRKEELEKNLESQKYNEALRLEFASKANEFAAYVDQEKAHLAGDSTADLEVQLKDLLQHGAQVRQAASDKLNAIKVVCDKLDAANVQDNKHTKLTSQDLTVMWDQLEDAIIKKQNLIEGEILTRKMGDVSAEQLKEFRETFNFFDKDKNNLLTKLEFKSCLQSLGVELSEEQVDKELAARGGGGADAGISFEAFTKFLVEMYKDTDSFDETLASFQTLANGKEFVTEQDLSPLKPEQIKYLKETLPRFNNTEGQYDYKKFVHTFFGK